VLILCVVLAGLAAPYASKLPDGLDHTVEQLKLPTAPPQVAAPLPDYTVPGVRNQRLGVCLAAGTGILLTFGATYLVGRLVSRRGPGRTPEVGRSAE
jgi:cobalt/nickel transport protein